VSEKIGGLFFQTTVLLFNICSSPWNRTVDGATR